MGRGSHGWINSETPGGYGRNLKGLYSPIMQPMFIWLELITTGGFGGLDALRLSDTAAELGVPTTL